MKSYQESIFGTFKGQDVLAYTFENSLGYCFKVMNYGATILEYRTHYEIGRASCRERV